MCLDFSQSLFLSRLKCIAEKSIVIVSFACAANDTQVYVPFVFQRGGSSGQGWGGARPKANRRNGSNGDGDDEDREDKRPSRGNIPGSLPLVASGENPRGEDPPSPDYKRHRKKQHGTITNEQFCHCLGQAVSVGVFCVCCLCVCLSPLPFLFIFPPFPICMML